MGKTKAVHKSLKLMSNSPLVSLYPFFFFFFFGVNQNSLIKEGNKPTHITYMIWAKIISAIKKKGQLGRSKRIWAQS